MMVHSARGKWGFLCVSRVSVCFHWWVVWNIFFSPYIGNVIIPIDSYFSEGLNLNHQPVKVGGLPHWATANGYDLVWPRHFCPMCLQERWVASKTKTEELRVSRWLNVWLWLHKDPLILMLLLFFVDLLYDLYWGFLFENGIGIV